VYAKNDQKVVQDGLQIISRHAKMRKSNENALYDPDLLPIQQIFQFLIQIIGMNIHLNVLNIGI